MEILPLDQKATLDNMKRAESELFQELECEIEGKNWRFKQC